MSAVIDIEPTHVTATGTRYRVWHGGTVLIESAREPLCEGARALVDKGVTGRIQMRRIGSDKIDIEGLIAVLATRTVSEGQTGTPRFAKWSAYEAAQ